MRGYVRSGLMMILLTLSWSGCGPAPSEQEPEIPTPGAAIEENATQEPEPAPSGQTEEETDGSEVSLRVLDWESTLELVEQNLGRVVVMDLWSTYCPPCIAEFPGLVEMHRDLGSQVACISVSVDYDGRESRPVESYRPGITEFLKKQGATFENVLLSTDSETLFNEKIEHGSIPVVYVYDQQGHLAGEFPDPEDPEHFTYEDQIRPLVEKLLSRQ